MSYQWPIVPLKAVAERIFVGLPISRYAATSDEDLIELPIIGIGDIVDGHLVEPKGIHRIKAQHADLDRFRIRPGDVLVSCRGTVLKSALVTLPFTGNIASSNIIAVRPGRSVLAPILLALFRSDAWIERLRLRSRSSTGLVQFTVKDFDGLPVPVPPLETQHDIAGLIEAEEHYHKTALEAAQMRRRLVSMTVSRVLLHDVKPEQERQYGPR